ncbi:uncharacterized protein JCM10292_000650 [Rhodotorula paludigena]|uniref:uncharacterized protein n=1 Tax=Rhodotorula paludigena TaxID=86838 RepID=UPI00317C85E5
MPCTLSTAVRNAWPADSAPLESDDDDSEDEDAHFNVRGNFVRGPDKMMRVQRERYINIEGSGEEEGDAEVDDEDAQDEQATCSHEQLPKLDNFLPAPSGDPAATGATVSLAHTNSRDKLARPAKRARTNRDPKGKGRAADDDGKGDGDDNGNDNRDKEGGSIGAGSDKPCPEEPDVRLAVLEDDAIDQLADRAGGRTAHMRTRLGGLTHASPIHVSTSLLASSTAATMRVVGRLRGSTIQNVSLHAATSAIAKDVVSRLPNRTEVLVNVVSTAADAVDLPVGHIGSNRGQWELFGSGTGGVITVWTRLVPRLGSCSFRAETTVAFDGMVIDVASVCRAFEGTGTKLGFTRKITPPAVAVKRTSRARRTLSPQQQRALDESITERDSAASPYAVKHAPVLTALKEAQTLLDADTTAQQVRVAKEGVISTVVVNRVRPWKPTDAFGKTVYWRQALANRWAVADAAPDTLVMSEAAYDGAGRVLHATGVFSTEADVQAAVLWLTGGRMAANEIGEMDVPLPKGALSSARTLLHRTEPAQQIMMAQSVALRNGFKGNTMSGVTFLSSSETKASNICLVQVPILSWRAYGYHLLVGAVLTLTCFGGSYAYSRGALVHRPTLTEHDDCPSRSKTGSVLSSFFPAAKSAPECIKLWGLLMLKYMLSRWELSPWTKQEIERCLVEIKRYLGDKRQAGTKHFHLLVLSRSITVDTSAPGVNAKDTFTKKWDGGKAAHDGH